MVTPLFFAPEVVSVKVGSEFLLGGAEGKHAAVVRRMRAGESIQLTDGSGFRASGKVVRIQGSEVFIRIEEVISEQLPALQLTLVQALAKGDRDELAVQAATELGALGVIPWQANRSVSRWEGAKAEKGRQRWQTIATEASKQSLRVFEPKIQGILTTKELVRYLAEFDVVLVLDPTANLGLSSMNELTGKIAIVVGPEGGIDEHELEALEGAGAKRVNMGNGILRTSTAGLAAISFLVGRSGLWNSAE